MKVADTLKNTINRFPTQFVFTYSDFKIDVKDRSAAIRHLNRMAAAGTIVRLSKGRYYKAEVSKFGEVPVSEYQVVKDLLEKDGKTIGYITGNRAFNELGLTTQISNIVHIGSNKRYVAQDRGLFKLKFVMQKNNITKENIPYLRVLDAIKFIKDISGTTVDSSVVILRGIFKKTSASNLKTVVRLAMNYPPSTRALLGAIIESVHHSFNTKQLSSSLSPVTSYKIGVSENILPTKTNWKIK